MIQEGLLMAHSGGVHGDGWSPGAGSSFRQGARQLLRAAPILKRRRRWYREEIGNKRSILGVSSTGAKYRPRVAPRGATRTPEGSLAGPRGACAGTLLGPWWVHSLPPLVIPEASVTLIFLYNFYGISGTLLMAGKPEIQKQQKTGTGKWVHLVNRLVQI